MKALILGALSTITDEGRIYYDNYVQYFKDSLAESPADVALSTAILDDLIIAVGDGQFSIYDTRNQCELSEYDVLILRGHGFAEAIDVVGTISEYAQVHTIKMINDYKVVRNLSKLLQAAHFHVNGLPVARTVYVNQAVVNDNAHLAWDYPCIMKATNGSHGNDNYVVKDRAEMEAIYRDNPKKHFVLQRFVPNKGDYRILIIGDEVLIIGRSAVEGSHLNNTSQGGEAVLVDVKDVPASAIMQSKDIMKRFGMTISGADVLVDERTGEYFFLEVNAQPQLMTGAFVPEKQRLVGKLLAGLANKS